MNSQVKHWAPSISRQKEEYAEYVDRIVGAARQVRNPHVNATRSAEVLDGGCRLYLPNVTRWGDNHRKRI